jgi:hypothetical protein
MYDSSLSATGYNVALFNVKLASPIRREKGRVTSMTVDADFRDMAPDK